MKRKPHVEKYIDHLLEDQHRCLVQAPLPLSQYDRTLSLEVIVPDSVLHFSQPVVSLSLTKQLVGPTAPPPEPFAVEFLEIFCFRQTVILSGLVSQFAPKLDHRAPGKCVVCLESLMSQIDC